jgi:Cu-Zn family superoxide dismutase
MRRQNLPIFLATCLGIVLVIVLNYLQSHGSKEAVAQQTAATTEVTKAIAKVEALGSNKVKGTVTFTKKDGGVEIVAELTGLPPGKHGFHVHEFGDCTMADGTCAGAHFNPTGAPHGGPDDTQRHAGDFGNIEADQSGKATYRRVDYLIELSGRNSIIGRSVIVHADPDDLKSQPSGNAGARIGCGVIGIADPKMSH